MPMTSGDSLPDPREVTFSQAQGLEELPGRPAPGELPTEVRILLWEAFDAMTTRASISDPATGSYSTICVVGDWEHLVLLLARRHLHVPSDDLRYEDPLFGLRGTDGRAVREAFRPFFLDGTPYNRILDLVHDAMRHDRCPPEFVADIKRAFEECDVAYFVDTSAQPTILPAATTEEREAIELAQQGLSDAGHSAANAHLRRAGELLRGGEWQESVHQSISAVETVARSLESAESRLGKILVKLQSRAGLDIHPALGSAFAKLFSWASDEPGVRHGGSGRSGRVGRAEAAFMVSSCAAFCTYLLDKQGTAAQTTDSGGGGGT